MPAYDAERFDPPAPVAAVALRDPRTGATLTGVEMVVDSGADVTLVPRTAVEKLGSQTVEGLMVELCGFDGSRSVASAVALEMRFLGRVFRGRFLVVDLESGILGRNVLNTLVVSLDGPRLVWDVATPSEEPCG